MNATQIAPPAAAGAARLWITSCPGGDIHRLAGSGSESVSGLTRLGSVQLRITLREADGSTRDVQITAPDGATLDDLGGLLDTPSTCVQDGLCSGSRLLPGTALLGGPGLREGDMLHVGGPDARSVPARAVLRLQVVGGPDAGLVVALQRGSVSIGRDPDCDVQLSDPDVSRRHALLTVTTTTLTIDDLRSTNGTSIDGEVIGCGSRELKPGQYLRIGESALCVSAASEPAAAVRTGTDGTRVVNRPPRLAWAPAQGEVELPARPANGAPQRMQWFAALVPALAGGALAAAMHNVQFLAFALLSPLIMVGTGLGDRLHWRRSRRNDAATFRSRERSAQVEIAQRLAAESTARRHAHPDPAAVLRTVTSPDCRLWERRRGDADHLDVRLGLAECPSLLIARRGGESRPAGRLCDLPVAVSLRRGPLGLAGPRGITAGMARSLLVQLAALHSPADLDIALLLPDESAAGWTWARWLPHLGGRVACSDDSRRAMVADLQHLIDARSAGHGPTEPAGWLGKWMVLILDRCGDLAGLPGLAQVLAAGTYVGITAVCIDEQPRRLPTACTAVAQTVGETGSRLRLSESVGTHGQELVSDRTTVEWAGSAARALAPLVDAAAEAASSIPDFCRLLRLVDLDEPTPAAILRRWAHGGDPAALLGVGIDGGFFVDLVRDGPHALVAGTTGAGKSELLQSLVAGLAVQNSPADLSFVLIDYKGGAAFADCARLPHTAGLVTDLDSHLTERALRSLDAELRRRETLFATAAAKDLDAYRSSPVHAQQPIGRLVLLVDEFAALADELPEFVSGLIGIAQRGRSLGVHLVLATQRPSGVISPQIRANTSLRIALRVADAAESTDVIGTEAAARIDKASPGRAYVRTGAALTEIQTARVGGAACAGTSGIRVAVLDEWGRVPEPVSAEAGGRTDLQLLVDAMRAAAAGAGIPAARRPWLPPLPARLSVRDVGATRRDMGATRHDLGATPRTAAVLLGLVDNPARQEQRPLTADLTAAGTMLVVGGVRSGRTTVLRTLAATAANLLDPLRLHLYALDCAGGGLQGLAGLPHCGALIGRDQPAALGRVLARLSAEVSRRHTVLAGMGVGSFGEAASAGTELAHLLLVIDGWEGFVAAADEYDTGQSVELLYSLIRESSAAGLTIAISGDRGALTGRLAGIVAQKFVLRLSDRADYALAGIPLRSVPTAMPPGRAIRAADCAEVQFAFAGDAPSTAAQWDAVEQIAKAGAADQTGAEEPGARAFVVRSLPARAHLSALVEPGKSTLATIGVGGDAAEPLRLELFAGEARWLVAGPPRSGRSTLLRTLLQQAARLDVTVMIAAPRRSPLLDDGLALGVRVLAPDAASSSTADELEQADGRGLILVDDSEAFLDTPAGKALCSLARRAGDGSLAIVVACRSDELALSYRGVATEARRSRSGVLLQPGPGDGDLFGVRLPRSRSTPVPGRGVLVCGQPQLRELADSTGSIAVQVALP